MKSTVRHSTELRELYHVLRMCSTDTQAAICEDLSRVMKSKDSTAPTPRGLKLAKLFQQAVKDMQAFDAKADEYVPDRPNTKGTNPVTTILSKPGRIEVKGWGDEAYGFSYANREIPHLRTTVAEDTVGKAWIDCVGLSDQGRPVVCEIKWKSDKNVFYGFIQLLTYLSELATENQIERSIKTKLFGQWDGNPRQHDLLMLLANAKPAGKKQKLSDSTRELARGFAQCLELPQFKASARLVGNIACVSCQIDEKKEEFVGQPKVEWLIQR